MSKVCYPFKFNSSSLSVEDFNSFVSAQWALFDAVVPGHFSSFQSLIFKLSKLLGAIIIWEVAEKKKEEALLVSIEEQIRCMDDAIADDFLCS